MTEHLSYETAGGGSLTANLCVRSNSAAVHLLRRKEGDVNFCPSISLLLPVVSVRVYDADDQRVVSLEFVPLPPSSQRSLG